MEPAPVDRHDATYQAPDSSAPTSPPSPPSDLDSSYLLYHRCHRHPDSDDLSDSATVASDMPNRGSGASGVTPANAPSNATATTLRPAPQPSIKRRESEAGDGPPVESGSKENNKRKRASSPPWHFPTVTSTTVKSADGRRVSARVNTNPPVLGENEGRARSVSQSQVQSASRSRPPSPPWKKFGADGPTSVQIDGKRKSGRVNKDLAEQPTRVSPRQRRKPGEKRTRQSLPSSSPKSNVKTMLRGKTGSGLDSAIPDKPPNENVSSSPSRKIAELQAKIAALQPTRSFAPPDLIEPSAVKVHKRKRSSNVAEQNLTAGLPSPPSNRKAQRLSTVTTVSDEFTRPSPRIKLRFSGTSRRVIPPPHPNALLLPAAGPPRLSVHQIIERYDLQEMQLPYLENERGLPDAQYFVQRNEKQAVEEAEMRRRILDAAQPLGALGIASSSLYQEEQQPEPPPQYGHHDHLVGHAIYLRQLQLRERNQHKLLAKKLAHEALDYWKSIRGPTEEDIQAEQDKIFRLVYRQVISDVRAKWDMVVAHVQQLRKEKWEAEQEAKRQERLQKQLEWSERMYAKQRGENESDSHLDDDDDSTGDILGTDTEDEAGDGEEENMSESPSESGDEAEEEPEGEIVGQDLEAYLKYRQAEPPDEKESESEYEDANEEMQVDESRSLHHPWGDLSPFEKVEGELLGDAEDKEFHLNPEPGGHDVNAEDAVERSQAGAGTVPSSSRRRRSETVTSTKDELDARVWSSDESVDMYDSDEDMNETDDNHDSSSEHASDHDSSGPDTDTERDAKNSMLAFLWSGKQIKNVVGLPTPTTSAEGDGRDRTVEVVSDDNIDPQAYIEDAGPGAEANEKVQEEGIRKMDPQEGHRPIYETQPYNSPEHADLFISTSATRSPTQETFADAGAKALVPVPTLLRGTLRSYQHAGLDWLASLYRNGTNGILADEMGLGKTIQTISLLGHLAERHEVWETHLVIVPTSVILNWVTEFQKFLPGFRVLGYYGSHDERAAKRRCWANDPHHEDKTKRGYNVVITSYNVAMQDINAIRVVQWHYLVLDEAHNIRNFNSQRWQVLIRLKTKARLLLTGTPLQNSLTELWSLLTFLTAGDDDPQHGDLEEFLSHWKEPVKEIFERGVSSLSTEAQKVVEQLHVSLRPFLLRRLKSEVEKDLPKKTESVVVCKLSKRQRQLYQEYMGLATTRASLQRGNAISAGKVLLSLRRVCNHPDLFDPRPIQTSLAMEQSAIDEFAGKETVIRRLLGVKEDVPAGLLVSGYELRRRHVVKRVRQLDAAAYLREEVDNLASVAADSPDMETLSGCQVFQRLHRRERKLQQLRSRIRVNELALQTAPIFGADLRELVTMHTEKVYTFRRAGRPAFKSLRGSLAFGRRPFAVEHLSDWYACRTTALQQDILDPDKVSERLDDTIARFAFCTPVVTAPLLKHVIPPRLQEVLRATESYPSTPDFAHQARLRTSVVFPDSRLLIYDSGKLQRLTLLLRDLQAKGSRSLIFTQMTGTLNILEQFLSLLNLPYLRLDGSTPVEKRQLYSAEFNRSDSKYQCMILSSRAGGVGLNLVGASSVIFYDLDWNPQMDRQCMDRAHRIGQVRDVEVYKMVSEKTVEENILRRARQKSLLDQTVIQEGHFTTEYQQPSLHRRAGSDGEGDEDDVAAAIERFLGGGEKAATQAIEAVEDREDVQAAQQARKEDDQDDADFADRSSKGPSAAATPRPMGAEEDEEDERSGHVELYMIRQVQRAMEGVPFVPPVVRRMDRHGRDPSHRPKRKR